MTIKRVAAVLTVVAMLSAVAAWSAFSHWLTVPVHDNDSALVFTVSQGATMQDVAADLSARGYAYPRVLSLYARQQELAGQLKVGEFEIPAGATPAEFLAVLVEGKTVSYPLTIIEGWTFEQMRDAVSSHPALVQTVSTTAEIMAAIGQAEVHPEGRFYPDTYRVTRGQTDVAVYQQAFDAMSEQLASAWAQRQKGLPFMSAYEALIMASIIEKETGADEEREQISGVFARRLHKGMRLQTDPTVIYGVGAAYRGDITRKHLTTDTPYNTYTRGGLPPTPIALPGRASLNAAVTPDDGDTLYFVASGLGDGRHYFSKTLKEHNEAVQRYLARTRGR
ncbi:MAG: endolytic transglycosylase MltG [Pseudomonadota bacterium]